MGFFKVKFVMSDALFDLAASSKATRRVSSILPNLGRKCSYRRNQGGEGFFMIACQDELTKTLYTSENEHERLVTQKPTQKSSEPP